MKKVFTFVAAALCAVAMSAKVVVLDPSTQTPISTEDTGNGEAISLTIDGIGIAYNGTLNAATEKAPADFRVFGNKTLTLSASSNISKVRIAGKANKASFTASVDNGSITKGSSYGDVTTKESLEDPLIVVENINATSVTLSITKQLRAYMIEVTLGEGGGEGEGGEGGEGEGGEGEGGDVVKKTYSMIEAYNYYDYLSEDGENITLYLYNDPSSEEYVQLDLIVPNGTGLSGIPAGTYTIDESYEAMSAVPGFYDEEYDEILGCWVFGEGDEDYWDLAEGTVTVQKSGSTYTLTINATAWDETAFEITYTGEITVEDGKFVDAVENTEANVQSAIKTLRNGQVLIRKNNKTYTILGQEVK